MSVPTSIFFIGAGKMGQPMVEHLRRANFSVTVCDVSAENRAWAASHAVDAVETVDGRASSAGLVISSLPNDGVLLSIARALAEHAPGARWVDTSTVSPAASAEAALIADSSKVAFLRATVSGNPVTARAAQLTVMTSGPRELFELAKPALATFSKAQHYLGEAEQARTLKLAINLMVAVSAGMLGEALALGKKGGLDWTQMLDIIEGSSVGSPLVGYKTPPLKALDYTSTFSGDQMIKDLGLILDEGARLHVPLPLAAHMMQMYETINAQGEGDLDYIATVRLSQRNAGI
jgi:3-hydroxyisobutyrate dehydrogenase-like beta-hydroxyacid dehydrogenase